MNSIIAIIVGLVIGAIILSKSKKFPWISLIVSIISFYLAYINLFNTLMFHNNFKGWLSELLLILGGSFYLYNFFDIRNKLNVLKVNILDLLNKKKDNYLSIEDKYNLISIAKIDNEKDFETFINILIKKGKIPFVTFEDSNKELNKNNKFAEFNLNANDENNKEKSEEVLKGEKNKIPILRKIILVLFGLFVLAIFVFFYKKKDISNYFFNKSLIAYDDKDFISYVKYLKISCQLDNPEACNLLGVIYQKGLLVKKDISKAIELFQKSCKKGNSKACVHLGLIYSFDENHINYKTGFELFKKACDLNNGVGCFNVGIYYSNGNKVKVVNTNYLKAFEYFKKAYDMEIEKGCKSAEFVRTNYLNKGITN